MRARPISAQKKTNTTPKISAPMHARTTPDVLVWTVLDQTGKKVAGFRRLLLRERFLLAEGTSRQRPSVVVRRLAPSRHRSSNHSLSHFILEQLSRSGTPTNVLILPEELREIPEWKFIFQQFRECKNSKNLGFCSG